MLQWSHWSTFPCACLGSSPQARAQPPNTTNLPEHISLSDVELMISKGIKYEILLHSKPNKSARTASRQDLSIIALLWLWLSDQVWSIDHQIMLHRSHQEISSCDPEGHLGRVCLPACMLTGVNTVAPGSSASWLSLIRCCWDDVRNIAKIRKALLFLSLEKPFAHIPELSKWVRQGSIDNSCSWECVPLRIITQTECDTTEKMTRRDWRMQGKREEQTNKLNISLTAPFIHKQDFPLEYEVPRVCLFFPIRAPRIPLVLKPHSWTPVKRLNLRHVRSDESD